MERPKNIEHLIKKGLRFMSKRMSAMRGFMLGVLAMIMLSSTMVMASPVTRELFFGVHVTVDGSPVYFAEGNQPFIMEDRTFLPVTTIAEILGVDVTWDADAHAVNIQSPSIPTAVNPITLDEIVALQTAWGEGLVAISTAYANNNDYALIAQGVLDSLYGYVDGVVLFKPTVAQEIPFRFTEAAAASYFIGGNIEEDTGFALSPWTGVRFGDDGQYIINGETALWMGSVFLTNGDGVEIRVEKSLGLYRDSNGDVRIQLHHSSVPFSN